MKHPLVLAITGASGVVYARRLLQVLLDSNCEVHLTISPSGQEVLRQELACETDLEDFQSQTLLGDNVATDRLQYHRYNDYLTPIASGSFLTSGMVVCPCSGSTLSGIARAANSNLIQRAADVHLKERRKLVLVPRETPLSLPQLDNMKRAHEAGAVILPASPGWYHVVDSLDDLVDFVVARILDQLEVENSLVKRWGTHPSRKAGNEKP